MTVNVRRWADVPWAVHSAATSLIKASQDADPSGYTGVPGLTHTADIMGWRAGPINAYWGGPRPVTNTLIGAALGAGLGFAGGAVADALAPDDVLEPSALKKRFALLGAALGGAPGLIQAYQNLRANKTPFDTVDHIAEDLKFREKQSVDLFSPLIPANRFAAQLMADDFTPAHLKSTAAGMIQAASASTGSSWVSPWDVARIAFATGAGAASGILVGKTLGALAGLSPQAQKSLQTTGWWSGLIKATVPRALSLPEI